jgi:hypothetical protein
VFVFCLFVLRGAAAEYDCASGRSCAARSPRPRKVKIDEQYNVKKEEIISFTIVCLFVLLSIL